MARPTRYKAEFVEQAVKLCRLGATDKELADFFGVTERTINAWKVAHPGFLHALKEGKQLADAEVADKLLRGLERKEHREIPRREASTQCRNREA